MTEGSEPSVKQHSTAGKPRQPAKIERVLAALIERPRSTRELELAPCFDHVGHSTAADLRRLNVELETERVEISGFGGTPTWIARYRIPDEGLEYARAVLQRMRERRRGRQ